MHGLEIPCLMVGSDVDPSNDLLGYVVFIRKTGDNSLDKRRHQHYRENVLLPFVEKVLQKYDQTTAEFGGGAKFYRTVSQTAECVFRGRSFDR